ncbi:hypothetical protein B0H12DRAFT_204622 [Mycena haematopus]|nr:hypothetical protein B0H12DRAFT_204622 [Mycena haematopus]
MPGHSAPSRRSQPQPRHREALARCWNADPRPRQGRLRWSERWSQRQCGGYANESGPRGRSTEPCRSSSNYFREWCTCLTLNFPDGISILSGCAQQTSTDLA